MSADGFKRLQDLLEELKKIEKKREIAIEHGASDNDLRILDREMKRLLGRVGKAAEREAVREARDAQIEANRIRDGKPQKPKPCENSPGNPNPPGGMPPGGGTPPPGGTPPGGGTPPPGGGTPPAGGTPSGGGATPSSQLPNANCIYTHSENTVWAWSRPAQKWIPFKFDSTIKEVKFVTGGIFAIAEKGAVLFDCTLGSWLRPLDSTPDLLLNGEGT